MTHCGAKRRPGRAVYKERDQYYDKGMEYAIVIVPRSGGRHHSCDCQASPANYNRNVGQ